MTQQRVFTTLLSTAVALSAFTLLTVTPAFALEPTTRTMVKHAAIGAGAGAILGGVSKEGSALRGAGYGAAAGLGSGLLDKSQTLNGRPMVKDTLKGAAIGAGASAALGKNSLKGAAVGAGSGAVWGWLRKNP